MVQCPHCHNSCEADFGMISCPSCKTLFAVDIDGNVQIEEVSEETLDEDFQEEDEVFEEEYVADSAEDYPEDTESAEGTVGSVEPEAFSLQPDENLSTASEEEFSSESVSELGYDLNVESEEVEDHSGGAEELNADESEEVDTYDSSDLSEIADYGNSEVSMARDGKFLYDLEISNIDSAELKLLVEESLTDQRLGINIKGLMKMVEGGRLEIKRINAIKASIIVNRLKSLAVSLSWRQNAITQVDIDE